MQPTCNSIDTFFRRRFRRIHVNIENNLLLESFNPIVCVYFAQISLSRMDVGISGIYSICMAFMLAHISPVTCHFFLVFFIRENAYFCCSSSGCLSNGYRILSFVHHFHSIARLLCLTRKNKETSRASLG